MPGYFYDLARSMIEKYTGEVAFPELFDKLVSEEVSAGKIEISDKGELAYRQRGREHSLHLTAMGVIKVGILALLIEKKFWIKVLFYSLMNPRLTFTLHGKSMLPTCY